MKHKFQISKEERQEIISSIKTYFYNEREEELGDLAADLMLDFIIDNLGPKFYNIGVNDSYRYMNERIEDLLGIQK